MIFLVASCVCEEGLQPTFISLVGNSRIARSYLHDQWRWGCRRRPIEEPVVFPLADPRFLAGHEMVHGFFAAVSACLHSMICYLHYFNATAITFCGCFLSTVSGVYASVCSEAPSNAIVSVGTLYCSCLLCRNGIWLTSLPALAKRQQVVDCCCTCVLIFVFPVCVEFFLWKYSSRINLIYTSSVFATRGLLTSFPRNV